MISAASAYMDVRRSARAFGLANRVYASLNANGRKRLHDDLTALWIQNNTATDGTTRVLAEYIEAVGTRA